GFYFIMLSGTFMVKNFISWPISARFGGEHVLMIGATLALCGPALSALLPLGGLRLPVVLFLPGAILSFGLGLAMSVAVAGAGSSAPGRAGAASGLLGFSQFMLASVPPQLGGFLPHDVALYVPLVMLSILLLGYTFLLGFR